MMLRYVPSRRYPSMFPQCAAQTRHELQHPLLPTMTQNRSETTAQTFRLPVLTYCGYQRVQSKRCWPHGGEELQRGAGDRSVTEVRFANRANRVRTRTEPRFAVLVLKIGEPNRNCSSRFRGGANRSNFEPNREPLYHFWMIWTLEMTVFSVSKVTYHYKYSG